GVQDRDNLLALQFGKADAALASAAIDAMVQAAIESVKGWVYDPPADAPISLAVAFAFAPGMQPSPQSAPQPGQSNAPDRAVRVGNNIQPPSKIHNVSPVYPKIAQSARAQGTVVIEARIERDGTVSHAQVLRSVPLLDEPSLEAVVQWRFTPTLVDGQPVPVLMTVTVNFTLQ
ncbi:MAG TPA: energy transducer TonB, partial [Vicinamibacterales bacterium]